MSKLKTKKAAAKRFKITRNKKILRRSQMGSHLRGKKSKSQIRKYRSNLLVSKADKYRIAKLLGH